MANNIKYLVLVVYSVGFLFSGCNDAVRSLDNQIESVTNSLNPKNLFAPKQSNKESISSSNDKYLTKKFTTLNLPILGEINYYSDGIDIKVKLHKSNSFISSSKSIGFYKSESKKYDNDKIVSLYKDAIKERGNYYNIYNGNINKQIIETIYGIPEKSHPYLSNIRVNLDKAIIEFDKDNIPKSALVRYVEFTKNIISSIESDHTVNIVQFTSIGFRNQISMLEADINSNRFLSGLISSSNLNIKKINSRKYFSNNSKQNGSSKSEKIKSFYALYKDGAISKEEFEVEKRKILNNETNRKNDISKVQKANRVQVENSAQKIHINSNIMNTILIQKYNEKYGTNFKTINEINSDLTKRNLK